MGYLSKSVSHKDFLALMILVAVVVSPSTIFAHNTYKVGGSGDWLTGFDYQSWSTRQKFHVKDKLVFSYDAYSHNVLEVTKNEYDSCAITTDLSKALTTGYDTVELIKGKHYYVCGTDGHCDAGQKVVIDVKA